MSQTVRNLTAEFVGTFGLVFIGAGSVVADAGGAGFGLVGVALAHGLVLSIMVTATMNISGGHLNPAVSLGLLLARKIDAKTFLSYISVQLLAGVVAALLIKLLFPAMAGELTSYGAPRVSVDVTTAEAILIEAILTFFLVGAVFGTAVSPTAPKVGGFGIGLVLVFDILAGGPLTGAAMNPARAFGPALAAFEWNAQVVYWVGPALGAALAAFVWGMILLPKEETGG